MKITKQQLRHIIKEELASVIKEGGAADSLEYPAFVTLVKGIKDPDEPAFLRLPKTIEAAQTDADELLSAYKKADAWKHRDGGDGTEKVNQKAIQFINHMSSRVGFLLQITTAILNGPTKSVGELMTFANGVQQGLKVIAGGLTEIINDLEHAKKSITKDGGMRAMFWISGKGPNQGMKVDGKMLEKLSQSKALKRIVQVATGISTSLDEFDASQSAK